MSRGKCDFEKETEAINNELSHDEFIRLLAMHSSKLMSFVRILTMNRQDDADEVFQMTCMVLWQKFSKYDPAGNFGAWGCRMAYYETLKHREAKGRIKLLSDEALELVADAAIPISAELGERRTALSECLKKLPEQQHSLIRQKYYEGVSVEQLAKQAGRSTYAIYRELSKVHGMLMRCVHRSVSEVPS